jgi:uncharacterized protein (DUF433 family)
MDWAECDVVERVPGKLGGAPVLRHSRVQADAVWENYQDATSEEVAQMFGLNLEDVRSVIAYAEAHDTPYIVR